MNEEWDFPHESEGNGSAKPIAKPPPTTVVKPKLTPEQWRKQELEHQAGEVQAKTFAALAAQPVVHRRSLIGRWLHTGAWMYVGPSKVGKSYLALQLIAAVAAGDKFLEWQCQKAEVLLLAAEDDDPRLQQRLVELGIANGAGFPAPEGCHVFNREDLGKLAAKFNPEDQEAHHFSLDGWLSVWLQSHPKVGLIVIDTEVIARLIWQGNLVQSQYGKKVTEVDYHETASWDKFARAHDLVILLVGHTGKTKGRPIENPFELQNATNTKVAGAAGQIVLWNPNPNRTDARQKERVFSVEGRDVPDGEFHIGVHRDETARWVSDGDWHLYQQTRTERELTQALHEQYEIPGVDAMAWISTRQLAEYTSFSKANIKRTLSRLLRKSEVVTVGDKQFRLVSRSGKSGGYRLESL